MVTVVNSCENLLAISQVNGGKQTRLLFTGGVFHCYFANIEIYLQQLLKHCNTDYFRNQEIINRHLPNCYKAPLILSVLNGWLLLPLANRKIYLMYHQIERVRATNNQESHVVFCDGTRLVIPVSVRSIKNQLTKAKKLLFSLAVEQEKLFNDSYFDRLISQLEQGLLKN